MVCRKVYEKVSKIVGWYQATILDSLSKGPPYWPLILRTGVGPQERGSATLLHKMTNTSPSYLRTLQTVPSRATPPPPQMTTSNPTRKRGTCAW